jgi:hypothetical protein
LLQLHIAPNSGTLSATICLFPGGKQMARSEKNFAEPAFADRTGLPRAAREDEANTSEPVHNPAHVGVPRSSAGDAGAHEDIWLGGFLSRLVERLRDIGKNGK